MEPKPNAESDAEFGFERDPETAPPAPIRHTAAAAGPLLTLAAVVDGDIAFEWGDAVAVVQQLIEQLVTSDPGTASVDFPNIETIKLDASGALHARLENGGTRSLTAALGDLLHQLSAEIDRPPALRLFAMRAISATPPLSLAEFTFEVADWAPPDCRRRLADMYQRARIRERLPIRGMRRTKSLASRLLAVGALAVVGSAVVFGALKIANRSGGPQTRPADDPPPAQAAPAVEVTPPAPQIRSAAVEKPPAQDIVLLPEARTEPSATDLASTDSLLSDAPRPDPSRPDPSRSEPRRAVQADQSRADQLQTSQAQNARAERLARANTVAAPPSARRPAEPAAPPKAPSSSPVAAASPVGPATKPGPGSLPPAGREAPRVTSPLDKAAAEEFQRARALFEQRAYARAADGFQHVIEMLTSGEAGGSDLRFVAGEYLSLSRASLASLQSHVYTYGDEGVTEPIALGPFLPPPPDPSLPKNRLAALELIIDARGLVEAARLVGESSQYRTGWWVSAAKAWKFQPAMKDGNAVRFLKRIVVADSKPFEPR